MIQERLLAFPTEHSPLAVTIVTMESNKSPNLMFCGFGYISDAREQVASLVSLHLLGGLAGTPLHGCVVLNCFSVGFLTSSHTNPQFFFSRVPLLLSSWDETQLTRHPPNRVVCRVRPILASGTRYRPIPPASIRYRYRKKCFDTSTDTAHV